MYRTTDQVPTPLPTPSAFAAHAAVFTPLLGVNWFKKKPNARKAAIVAVEKRWRWMRLKLQKLKWLKTAGHVFMLWRCAAHCVDHRRFTGDERINYFCTNRRICPWCYGRSVYQLCRRVCGAMWNQTLPTREMRKTERESYILVGFRTYHNVFPPPGSRHNSKLTRKWMMEQMVGMIDANRQREVKLVKADGSVISHTFHMTKGGEFAMIRSGVLAVARRRSHLIAKLVETAELHGEIRRYTVIHQVDGKDLNRRSAVSLLMQCFRYPAGLFRNRAGDVIRLLKLLKRKTLISQTGIFNRKVTKKRSISIARSKQSTNAASEQAEARPAKHNTLPRINPCKGMIISRGDD